jgi:hypothetical protein
MTACNVFVSYSQPDRDTAFGIVKHLEREGIPCWVAPRDIDPGVDWAAAIIDAIAGSCVMVLVFSASANTSPQVRREVERAVNRGVAILPFRVEDVQPTRSLEYFLSSQHWMDAFPPPLELHYARLGTYLRPLLAAAQERSVTSAAPPAAAAPPRPSVAAPGIPVADAATLQRLSAELARYIGPVATLLVQRAALRAADVDALITQLGTEIESDSERRLFLSASRQALRGSR